MTHEERMEAELKELEAGILLEQGGRTDDSGTSVVDGGEGVNSQQTSATTQDHGQASDDDSNSESYKSRWKSLEGIVRSLNAKMQTQDQYIESLSRQLSEAQAAPVQSQSFVPSSTTFDFGASSLIGLSAKAKEVYGEEMGDIVSRFELALLESENKVKELTSKFAPVEANISNLNAETQQSRFDAQMNVLCPNWSALNSDQIFIGWLERKAPLSSGTIKEVMLAAYNKGDANTVAEIFNTYNRIAQSQINAAKQQQQPPTIDPRLQLVTPGKSGSSPPPNINAPKIWTMPEIDKFYKDVEAGIYKGRDDEIRRIEVEILSQ